MKIKNTMAIIITDVPFSEVWCERELGHKRNDSQIPFCLAESLQVEHHTSHPVDMYALCTPFTLESSVMPTYNQALSNYITRNFAVEDESLSRVRKQLAQHGLPTYTVNPEEGRFLQFLVKAGGVKLALELGTLGGYSAIWIARGLPKDGKLITVEKNPRHAAIAREHFTLADLNDKIELHEGDARYLLPTLADEGPFDFVFLDADNSNYPQYLDWVLHHLRPGGIIAAHNAFVHGMILNKSDLSTYVEGTRAFNIRVAQDPRLTATIFPAGDGMTIAVLEE